MPFIRWDVEVPPRSAIRLTYQGRFRLPIDGGPEPHEPIRAGDVQLISRSWADLIFSYYPSGGLP